MADQDESKLHDVEFYKALSDQLKHLATLATGSIVLLVGFLEKFLPYPKWRAALVISLIGFIVTLLLAMRASAGLVNFYRVSPQVTPKDHEAEWKIVEQGLKFAWCFFIAAIVALVIFASRNIFP